MLAAHSVVASATAGLHAHADTVAAPARVEPTAKSVFRGEFVVTFIDNTSPNAVARKHGAKHVRHYGDDPANKSLISFGKGTNASSAKKALLRDARVRDAYPVYADVAAPMADSPQAQADTNESEPNNTVAGANTVAASATPNVISGSMVGGSDVDYFKFTLASRSGVFFDVDSKETGLSTNLDTILEVYEGTGTNVIEVNDDGRDFETLSLNETTETALDYGDSSLYLDLAAGSYVIKLRAYNGTSGSYQLKLTADSSYTAGVPVLNSLPGAADTLYLDFDGHGATDPYGTYNIPAYDINGNGLEFSPAERLVIQNVWKVVADAYAPFNVNVTTSYGGAYNDGLAWRQVIGNGDGSEVNRPNVLGVAWSGGYATGGPTYKTGFTFANNFHDYPDAGVSGQIVTHSIEMGNTSSHEIGHAMDLDHYLNAGPRDTFMYTPDFGLSRERWSSGTNDESELQDDLARISAPANTFGYRADDHGNTRPAATILSAVGNNYSASGVIHSTGDFDFFRFSGSGATTITLDIPEHLGHLDGELYLYNAAGTLLQSSDLSTRLGGSISLSLPSAGDYYAEVRSDGGYGDLGTYNLKVATIVPATGSIAGRAFRDVTFNNTYETGGGDSGIGGVTVFLDADNDSTLDGGEVTATTAGDGTFTFAGLANGTYHVKQVTPAGYVSNAGYPNTVVSGGGAVTGIAFGNFPIVYQGGVGSDAYTVRLKAGDASVAEIVETSSGLTYSAAKSLLPSLTFNGNNGNDSLTIASDLGPGTAVTFNGGTNAAFTDTLQIDAGAHAFAADANVTTARLALILNGPTAAVSFSATQHLELLQINAGTATLAANGSRLISTDALTITGGKLDLKDNDLIVRSGLLGTFNTGTSTYGGVQGLIAAGRNGSAWNGNGIITTMPDALTTRTTLGAATAAGVFNIANGATATWQGETVTGGAVLVKYTHAGDADLTGRINGDDYFHIDGAIASPGASGWLSGDFDYNGKVNGDDYWLIDGNIGKQTVTL
ncbi:MAG TPA: SdrD B-like domain-containing protein [Tepidisphaeraceae bacterium]|nr:SdrD B-like domain-containing protein [Tepidisphaeraceae bacterium]